jgi:hypothetical protein
MCNLIQFMDRMDFAAEEQVNTNSFAAESFALRDPVSSFIGIEFSPFTEMGHPADVTGHDILSKFRI